MDAVPVVPATYLVGLALTIVGAIIRVLSYQALGPDFNAILSLRSDHKLATHSVYSIVRHPSYSGFCLVLAGSVMCQLGPGSFWAVHAGWRVKYGFGGVYIGIHLLLFVTMLMRLEKEDAVLRRVHGKQWEDWARKTRYKLVPYVF